MQKSLLARSICCAAFTVHGAMLSAQNEQQDSIETVVVTGVVMSDASTITADPQRLRQPLPAHDGGEYLKALPGFSLVRKGGSGGDPMFRGMAASRLSIVNDDGMILGGCSSRMDPPTAYITPQNYDRLVIIKGPQTVRYLPANATVRFERDHEQASESGTHGSVGITSASFGKRELNLNVKSSFDKGYVRLLAGQGESDNYRDAKNNLINSHYDRQSYSTEVGYTGTTNTVIASYTQSMGEAAYADRSMDGTRFDRRQWQLRLISQLPLEVDNSLEMSLQRAEIDHVMDNYSLRIFVPSMMSSEPAAMNPTRETENGRIELTLTPAWNLTSRLGIDASQNDHQIRMSMKQYSMPFQSKPLLDDAAFEQFGLFSEIDYQWDDQWAWYNGIRSDRWELTDLRQTIAINMMQQLPNPTAFETRTESLTSGFSRLEYKTKEWQAYAGLGRAERFPDYWEALGKGRSSDTSISALYTNTEKTTQLDVGVMAKFATGQLSASAYYGAIDDFILVELYNPMKPERIRNIDATVWGMELGGEWRPIDNLALRSSLAIARGSNDTDGKTLPQLAPAELRLSGDYQFNDWTLGAMYRLVAGQQRFALNQGTIVGLDTSPTAGFGVLSLNASHQWTQWRFNVGIDNVMNKHYQEFLSRGASSIAGFSVAGRIPEPGRVFWANASYTF
jgi:iron complex outermembrane receptor protein